MNESNRHNQRESLFLASCMALAVTSMAFAFRAKLETVFADQYGLSKTELGFAFGPAFWGFFLAMVIGGSIVDWLGMKRIVFAAFLCHAIGIIITLFARNFIVLFTGTLFIGIGNGFVEAALNPLVATLYPEAKTKMLNKFHVWFPGGIVIGSLVAVGITKSIDTSWNWQLMFAVLFLPLIAYGWMFVRLEFPKTERVEQGVSTKEMWKAIGSPIFLFMCLCMALSAPTELATKQKIESFLNGSEVNPILVLGFISAIMALGRLFAGPAVHRLNIVGMLLFSAVFSLIGILWLSYAHGYVTYLAAAVFAMGVCFFWPTMLSYVAVYIPKSGALGLSTISGVGMFVVSIALPIVGKGMDEKLSSSHALQYMAFLPLTLIVLFVVLQYWTIYRSK